MSFARFMATPVGRAARIVVGAVLIILGLSAGGTGGIILAIVGLLPLIAGAANVCFISPLIKAPFKGRDAR